MGEDHIIYFLSLIMIGQKGVFSPAMNPFFRVRADKPASYAAFPLIMRIALPSCAYFSEPRCIFPGLTYCAYNIGSPAYTAAQVTRSCFHVCSFGKCA